MRKGKAWLKDGPKILRDSFSSVQFSHPVMSDSLRPHEPQHTRPPCPSPALPKNIYRWQISIWKDVPHHMLSGKCRLKQQWGDFPGGPVAKTPCSQHMGPRFILGQGTRSHMPQREQPTKQKATKWDITTHLLGRLKSGTLTTLNTEEDVEQW